MTKYKQKEYEAFLEERPIITDVKVGRLTFITLLTDVKVGRLSCITLLTVSLTFITLMTDVKAEYIICVKVGHYDQHSLHKQLGYEEAMTVMIN